MNMNDNQINEDLVISTISKALETFYTSLIEKINGLKLDKVLVKKNPYLFYAKGNSTASEIIDGILLATVSSSEETIFGNVFFEPLAIAASGGVKSMAEGADLEITTADAIYLVAVKSGTAVFNADSRKRQEENFLAAAKRAQQAKKSYHPIIGYGYGRKNVKQDKFYKEFAGQAFWEEITGDPEFYKKIIKYMGKLPELYLDDYKEAYNNAKNRLEHEFLNNFCLEDGSIDWDYLIEYNSAINKPKKQKKKKV